MAGGVDLGDFGDEIVEKQARKRVGIVVEPVEGRQLGPPQDGRPSGRDGGLG